MDLLILAGVIYLIVYQRKLHERIESIHADIVVPAKKRAEK